MKVTIQVKCIQCEALRDIAAGEIPPGEQPMCDKCGNVMIATVSKVTRDSNEPRMEKSPYPPPFVVCHNHRLRRGYCLCVHVAAGQPAQRVELSEGEDPGMILCTEDLDHTADQFILICEGCAIERGFVKAADCEKREARRKRKREAA